MESSMADYDVAGVLRSRSGGTLRGVAPANAYPTRDGSEVLIAGNADAVFARLCAAMDQPEMASDPMWSTHGARGEREHQLDGIIADWTKTDRQRRSARLCCVSTASRPAASTPRPTC